MKIFPSQIRDAITRMFPGIDLGNSMFLLDTASCPMVQAIASMFDHMPSEILRPPPQLFCDYIRARAAIETICGSGTANQFPSINGRSVIQVFIEVLAACPDAPPPEQPERLSFLGDAVLADDLARDIGAIDRAIESGDWKVANVLAGAAMEALLLNALSKHSEQTLSHYSKQPLMNWDLDAYTRAASDLNLVKSETVIELTLCRGYRNLIHPGRAMRTESKCDRGTAFAAVAALEHVVRDLGRPSG